MFKFFMLGLSFLSIAVTAQAANYNCGSVQLAEAGGRVVVAGIEGARGLAHGSLDPTYRPRANYAGSTRYELPDACDEGNFYAILDRGLSEGQNGQLTLENDCDTDGGAPSFNVYNCRKE